MKINKYSIITISIVVPLIITVLIAMYSYGAIGDWTKNQEKFIDYVFDQKATSAERIEEYVKFNSGSYNKLTTNIELFDNYATGNTTIKPNSDGVFQFENFKMASYVLLGDAENNKYSYNFYFYDIDNSNVDMSKIAFVLFESTDVNDTTLLAAEIDKYKDEFLAWDPTSSSTSTMSIYAQNTNKVSKNMFFTSGKLIEDVDGSAKIVDGIAANRLLYYCAPNNTFNSQKSLAALGNCQFAIFSLGYDKDGATDSLEIITTGKITNIASSADAYTKNNKTQPGYTLATLTGLRNAGYTEYIWKTVLIHSLIALVISGFLGFMFYKTWNVDFKEDSKVTNKNIKNKKR